MPRLFSFAALIFALSVAAYPGAAAENDAKVLSPDAYKQAVAQTDYRAHTIKSDRFLELMKDPKTVILDMRDEATYHRAHIRGAKYLGADVKAEKLEKLAPDKDATVLLYCSNSLSLNMSRMMSLTHVGLPQMLALGYKKTYYLEDAIKDTTRTGTGLDRTDPFPMVTDAEPTIGGAAANPTPEKDVE